jgi:hypothetical protein
VKALQGDQGLFINQSIRLVEQRHPAQLADKLFGRMAFERDNVNITKRFLITFFSKSEPKLPHHTINRPSW